MYFLVTVPEQPGNTEVAENNVSIRVNKDVLGLDISMYDIVSMDVLDSKKLHRWIRRGQVIDLTGGLQVLPCRIVLLPHRVFSVQAGFANRLRAGTPISTMSKMVSWKASVHTVTR